jgi:hypothetical protein
MTERLAQPADDAEGIEFDRIRSRFIQEAALHLDIGNGVAGLAEQPDHWFWHLMEVCVMAKAEGQPQPHPWFIEFCARLMDEDDSVRKPPAEPILS